MKRKAWIVAIFIFFVGVFTVIPSSSFAASGGHVPDDALRKAINEELAKTDPGLDTINHDPTTADLESVIELQAAVRGIDNLTGLEKATNLKTLNVNINNISDVTPLESLTSLERLMLDGNAVTDITPLLLLNNLWDLRLDGNAITDITTLTTMNDLSTLYLNNNPITDFTPLIGLNNLTALQLYNTSFSNEDLTAIKDMNLISLNISNTNVNDLTPIQDMDSLYHLRASENGITVLPSLSNLVKLKTLEIDQNAITDLSPIGAIFNNLTTFKAAFQQITLPEITLSPTDKTLTMINPIIDVDGTALSNIDVDQGTYDGATNEIVWTNLAGTETERSFGFIKGEQFTGMVTQPITWSNHPPVIDASNKTITEGDAFDELDGVTATDVEDGDITSEVKVTTNEVDTSTPGDYTVTYEVTDSDGETATKTITVTVEAVETVEEPPSEEGDGEADADGDSDSGGDDVVPLDPPNVDRVTDGDNSVTGSGEPGATIHITHGGGDGVIGTGVVDEDGNFEITLDRPAIAGEELIFAQFETDEDGYTIPGSASDPVSVIVQDGEGITIKVENGDDEVENGTITVEDDDNTLPSTATSTFNWLLGGFIAMVAGVVGLFTRRKGKSNAK